jgi:hypothetical protein
MAAARQHSTPFASFAMRACSSTPLRVKTPISSPKDCTAKGERRGFQISMTGLVM